MNGSRILIDEKGMYVYKYAERMCGFAYLFSVKSMRLLPKYRKEVLLTNIRFSCRLVNSFIISA